MGDRRFLCRHADDMEPHLRFQRRHIARGDEKGITALAQYIIRYYGWLLIGDRPQLK